MTILLDVKLIAYTWKRWRKIAPTCFIIKLMPGCTMMEEVIFTMLNVAECIYKPSEWYTHINNSLCLAILRLTPLPVFSLQTTLQIPRPTCHIFFHLRNIRECFCEEWGPRETWVKHTMLNYNLHSEKSHYLPLLPSTTPLPYGIASHQGISYLLEHALA